MAAPADVVGVENGKPHDPAVRDGDAAVALGGKEGTPAFQMCIRDRPSVIQIVGAALKQEHGALPLPQSLPHPGVGAHIIVGQRFHVGSVIGVADQLGQIGAVRVSL